MKNCCLLIFICISISGSLKAQDFKELDLQEKSYLSLQKLFEINKRDSVFSTKIASVLIEKAKEEKDSTKIAEGYAKLAFVSRLNTSIKYLDTCIAFSKNSLHVNYPALGYLFKSKYLFENEEYELSLKNGILGYQYASKKNNVEQQLTALHQINAVNELWGDYHKVLKTEFLAYDLLFKNKNIAQFTENYLYSLEGIGKCYVRLKKPDSALYYFNKGIVESLKKKDTTTYLAFVSRTGMALYVKENYEEALDSLIKGDLIRESYNNNYLPYFYFYAGNSYCQTGKKELGISYFIKIDSIYDKKHVLSPELPMVYDILVSYYRDKGDEKRQLKYLYKLVQIQRIIDVKKDNIKEETDKEYHIPKLLEDKEEQIADLTQQNQKSKIITWVVIAFLSIMVLFSVYYFKRQKKFKERFENLIAKQEKDGALEKNQEITSDISIAIIEGILKNLDDFEAKNTFLNKTISLSEMAKSFGTNSSYLSKVINLKKDKNVSNYINDLRVEYIVKELKTNSKFRKYTIKAIANECGFNSSESFSKAFYKKYGIYPSYFIKKLDE